MIFISNVVWLLHPFILMLLTSHHITLPEQLEKYISITKEYYTVFSTSHQHNVIHTKDGEIKMKFPDLDNIISLLHKQSRIPVWNTGERGDNQSTNHLVDIIKPLRSSLNWKVRIVFLLATIYHTNNLFILIRVFH